MIYRSEKELASIKAHDLHLLLRFFDKEIAKAVDAEASSGKAAPELGKIKAQRELIVRELGRRPSHGT